MQGNVTRKEVNILSWNLQVKSQGQHAAATRAGTRSPALHCQRVHSTRSEPREATCRRCPECSEHLARWRRSGFQTSPTTDRPATECEQIKHLLKELKEHGHNSIN